MERQLHAAMAGNFLLFLLILSADATAAHIPRRAVQRRQGLIGIVLSGYVIAALLIRPFSGFIVDTFNRKKVLVICFFFFFYTLLGIYRRGHDADVRNSAYPPRTAIRAVTVANSTVAMDVLPSERRNEGIGYYGLSNNLAMAFCPYCPESTFTPPPTVSEMLFWIAFVLALIGFLLRVTHKATLSPCNAQQAEDEP